MQYVKIYGYSILTVKKSNGPMKRFKFDVMHCFINFQSDSNQNIRLRVNRIG